MIESKIIGLTGGIGSGKTTVARYIESLGHKVIYTDLIAKEIMSANPDVKEKIVATFGKEAYSSDMSARNSEFLASLVFASGESAQTKLAQLNSIVHPAVIDEMIRQTEIFAAGGTEQIFVECALIYELDLDEGFDYIIDVFAPEETCISRVMQRNNISRSQAESRLAAQMSPDEKRGLADFVIQNTGSLEELKKATDLILQFI